MTADDAAALDRALGALDLLRGSGSSTAARAALERLRGERDRWRDDATLRAQLLAAALGMPSDIAPALLTRRLSRLIEGLQRWRQGGDRGELLALVDELGRPAS